MDRLNLLRGRRRFPRRHFRRKIGVLSSGKYFMTSGFEIGEGGISFRCDRKLKVGALVVLNFQVPFGDFISVRAEIRNQSEDPDVDMKEKNQYGCAFENITFNTKRGIRHFVTNRPESEI